VELFLKRKNEERFLKRKSNVTLAMKRVGCKPAIMMRTRMRLLNRR
jgi:hypothetical protein